MHGMAAKRLLIALGTSSILLTTGCESSGGIRLGSVGTTPDSGSGSGGTSSQPGGGSGSGSGTTSGGQSGSSLSRLPVGGIVGPNGVGNTGALANTGDPGARTALSPILVASGNAVLGVADTTNGTGGNIPGGTTITGTVTRLLTDTGQALVKAGNGQAYLVDGLGAAVGDAVTISLADKTITSPASGSPAVGVSVLSPTQLQGSLVTAGAGSGNQVTTVQVSPVNDIPVTSTLQATGSNVINATASTVNGAASTPLESPATAIVSPVTGSISGALGVGGSVTSPGGSAGGSLDAVVSGTAGGTVAGTTGLLGID